MADDITTSTDLTNETVDLLRTMIRNECVNDGTAESGHEVRNADVLESFLEGCGLDMQRYEPTPGRGSLVARISGSDPEGNQGGGGMRPRASRGRLCDDSASETPPAPGRQYL